MLQTEISRQATVATVLEGIRQDAILGKFSGEKQISETEIATISGVEKFCAFCVPDSGEGWTDYGSA
ncbi:MAG: hypothetical protein ACLTI1_03660 [Clostridia bacterium]